MKLTTPETHQDAILAKIPRPKVCDLCEEGEPKNPTPYGPFTIYLCTGCHALWQVREMKKQSGVG